VDSKLMNMPATGLASYVVRERACTSPNSWTQGTSVSFAGSAARTSAHAAQAAVAGVRVIDLPGSPPRGAPV
jgi:hypothetical protein